MSEKENVRAVNISAKQLTLDALTIYRDWVDKHCSEHPELEDNISFYSMVSAITVVCSVAKSCELSKEGMKEMIDEVWDDMSKSLPSFN